MEYSNLDYSIMIASIVGVLVFLYSAKIISEIIKLLPPGSKTRTYWNFSALLILLFALGYIASLIAVLFSSSETLDAVIPILYLGGAAFVFLMVTVSLRTYKAILESAE